MTALKTEREAFETLLPELLENHRGEFVVVTGDKFLGFHSSFAAAYAAAVGELGADATFLVAEVAPRDPQPVSLSWSVGALLG